MKRLLNIGTGLLYSFLWLNASIACGIIYAYLPCTILLVNPHLYRKIYYYLNTLWELYVSFLAYLINIKFVLSGDRISNIESAILIINHRTSTDWNFVMSITSHSKHSIFHNLQFIIKESVRHIPFIGWLLQMSGHIFVRRNWKEDQSRMVFSLDYTVSTLKNKVHLLIFPEGTVCDNEGKIKSDAYAEVNGLPKYDYVLHPKTTGFCFLVDYLRQERALDAIYDITMGYPDRVPEKELDFFKGNLPKEVHLHTQRIDASELPHDKKDLEKWLKKRWMDKETRLEEFYKNKRFSDKCWPETTNRWLLYFIPAYYCFLILLTYTLLILSPLFRLMTFLQFMFFMGLSFSKYNFTHLEVAYYKFWEKNIKGKLL